MGKQVNRSELAEVFGKSLPTISTWITKGCPVVERGRRGKEWVFDTADVANWLEQVAVTNIQGDTSKLDMDEAKRRKTAAEAALAELDLAKARGEVIESATVEKAWSDLILSFRAKVLSVPPKMAPMLIVAGDVAEIERLLDDSLREALTELARYGNGGEGDDAE